MATFTGSTSAQRAELMRNAWPKLRGGASSVFVYFFEFFTAYPPLAQGLYYILSSIWPLVGLASYQDVTGHIADAWHVEVMCAMLLVIGGTLCLAAYRKMGTPEVLFLAFGSALGMTAVDIHLLTRGFSALYFVDALLEVALVAFWVYGWRRARTLAAVGPAAPAPTMAPTNAPSA